MLVIGRLQLTGTFCSNALVWAGLGGYSKMRKMSEMGMCGCASGDSISTSKGTRAQNSTSSRNGGFSHKIRPCLRANLHANELSS